MTELDLSALTACGAHQRGHFQLSSGLHSGDYLQCALFLAHPRRTAAAGLALAARVRALGLAPAVVVAPAMGGLIIGHEVARALDLPFVFTERVGSTMALRRGFTVAAEQLVLVVEDVVTTGRSTREVVEVLAELGGRAVGVVSVVNRTGCDNPFAPLPYAALLGARFPTWPADSCPLCATGEPLSKPGSRPVS